MNENILKPYTINDLLDKTFYVDSYQRGYRWGETEVKALLQDIYDFSIKEGKINGAKYWLQPIIVKEVEKVVENKTITCYELIDGQQRLSTIYLIYSFLKNKKPFSINYNTRTSSLNFLHKINSFKELNWKKDFENTDDDKIDNFHFFNSFKIIQTWFDSGINKETFLSTLLNQTNVIWYELVGADDTLPKTVFEQINIGKIPLTNAELVKALYLNSSIDSNKRDEIAQKWDRIEYALNDKSFWAFISNNINLSHNRIEYLLDLISGKYDTEKTKEEKLHTFLHFYPQQNRELNWKKVEENFQTLLGWYETPALYHYVGYLITANFYSISELIDIYSQENDKPKSAFIEMTIGLIADKIKNYNLEDLSYEKPSDYQKIVKVLLLFNIQTTIKTTPYNYFPFHKFKSKDWSLEHIHAQQSETLKDPDAITEWVKEIKTVIEGFVDDSKTGEKAKELLKDFETSLLEGKNIKMGNLPNKVFDFFGDTDDEVHGISNMALLDKETNSSLNNSVFPIKRKKIFEAELETNSYIPLCTKNVFLKYYSKEISHMQFWSRTDKDDYMKSIYDCLEPFKKKVGV